MKGLEAITKNPVVKAVLLKQLVKVMQDNKIKLIAITMDEKGKIDFVPYTDDVKVIAKTEINKLIKLSLDESNNK